MFVSWIACDALERPSLLMVKAVESVGGENVTPLGNGYVLACVTAPTGWNQYVEPPMCTCSLTPVDSARCRAKRIPAAMFSAAPRKLFVRFSCWYMGTL